MLAARMLDRAGTAYQNASADLPDVGKAKDGPDGPQHHHRGGGRVPGGGHRLRHRAGVEAAIHMGISEFYVKKGGKLTFTMIHNWAEQVGVRPRTGISGGGGRLVRQQLRHPEEGPSVQTYPTARLVGKGAVARFNTVAVAQPGRGAGPGLEGV